MFNGLDCQKCSPQIKEVRGCEKDIKIYRIEGYEITRCPLTYVSEVTKDYLFAYTQWVKGYLPNGEGWLNQPMKILEVIKYIDILVNRYQEDKNGKP